MAFAFNGQAQSKTTEKLHKKYDEALSLFFYNNTLFDHGVQLKIFLAAEIGIKNRMFQHRSDFLSEVVGRSFAKPTVRSGSWIDYAHQHTECGSFSAAVRPQHAKNLTPFYFEIQVIDRR